MFSQIKSKNFIIILPVGFSATGGGLGQNFYFVLGSPKGSSKIFILLKNSEEGLGSGLLQSPIGKLRTLALTSYGVQHFEMGSQR
jgi:hypothetical protein